MQPALEGPARAAARRARAVARRPRALGDLRGQRLDGMAAELAAGLADGADCPVCGATEHPRPAEHDGPVVTAADEQAARDVVESTEAASAAAAAVSRGHERELAVLRGRSGDRPLDELRTIARERTRPSRPTAAEAAARPRRRRRRSTRSLAARDSAAAALAADREELQARTAESVAVRADLAG